VSGGVDAVQIREKDLPGRSLYEFARDMLNWVGNDVPVIINSRADVALAAGASGVHLGKSGLPVSRVRSIAPEGFLIGYSAHSVEEALEAERCGADYVTLSPVFPTGSKPGAPPVGLDVLGDAASRLNIPVIALGGINAANAGWVGAVGAAGIAVISAVYGAEDPRLAALRLRNSFQRKDGGPLWKWPE